MFDTLGSFSVIFFILSTILILLVVFEKQCLALEAKFDAKMRQRKRAKRQAAARKSTQYNRPKVVSNNKSTAFRKPGNFAA